MILKLRLECPYCGKEHVHNVEVGEPGELRSEEVGEYNESAELFVNSCHKYTDWRDY